MKLSDLWNELSGYPMSENVVIDATGIRIGRDDHIDVPVAADVVVTPTNPFTLRWDRDRHAFDVV